ncbi:hypothetical protein [Peribacillus glennii]|uniref:Resolvase HTH domain-containing protein n=1 Tax=Peribacillus glennii TaxID=2303991 RepID=A0A372LHD8_9BACI|nr:hypothetical protein [Peribacillus glennii]RFU65710.1 hypothetical protein D0466_07510 [Peribacillus glennii]
METIFIILLAAAILLLIFSFFKRDNVRKLQEELEELTLTHMQDIYHLKRKIRILEEELLIQEDPAGGLKQPLISKESLAKQQPINEILKAQVLSLYQQGLSLEQITKQSTLSIEAVRSILEENRTRGLHDE